jgi:alpha-tubulin suppressor-like RCC1 family protein
MNIKVGVRRAVCLDGARRPGERGRTRRPLLALGLLVAGALCAPVEGATLAAGSRHTVVRSSDGRVWTWGDNTRGQLGLGTRAPSAVPVALAHLGGIVAVAAGLEHSLALNGEGEVLAWGANDAGQLGDGSRNDRLTPARVPGLPSVRAIAAGVRHSLALGADGSVWAWGDNSRGQVGAFDPRRRARPVRIDGLKAGAIAAGAYHSAAVGTDGVVTSWGDDGRGDGPQPPSPVGGLPAIVAVSGGNRFTLALTAEGAVFGWGQGDHGQIGAARPAVNAAPVRLAVPGRIASLAAGDRHALAVTTDGLLLSWGDDARGQLGRDERSPAPFQVVGLSTIEAAAASFGAHSVAVTTDGVLWAWGANESGQVGDGTALDRDRPVQITEPGYACLVGTPVFFPPGGSFARPVLVTVRCATPGAEIHYTTDGATPTIADPVLDPAAGVHVDRTATLRARAFRRGMPASNVATATYDLGTGTQAMPGAPALDARDRGRRGSAAETSLVFTPGVVAAGLSHSLVLKPDGTVWGFGRNVEGQLGDATFTNRLYPVQVSGLTGVAAVAAGAYHSIALKSDGTVWTWGYNGTGQIGNGTTANRNTPVQVLTGAVAVAGGSDHTVAVKSDGTAWAWGRNQYGQLGDGTTAQRTTPVQVAGGFAGATKVAAGLFHSGAVKADGTVWCWGLNAQGQLGDGTTTDRLTPVRVDGATSILEITVGRSNLWWGGITSLARRDDGILRGWGYNSLGEIGDGTTLQRVTAVSSLATDVGTVALGAYHGLAARTDGSLWGWGQNASGEVGDGTTTQRVSPVSVAAPANVVAVAGGGAHSLAVTDDGSVWAWGSNASGQLGDGTTANRTSPRQIADPGFSWRVATPVLAPVSGTYTSAQTVTVTVATPTVTIRYTTDGSEPTDQSTVYTAPVAVATSLTLKVKAWKTGWATSPTASETYTLKAVTPAASPAGGSYTTAQNVTLSTTTSGATIRYTTDGTEPTGGSTAYASPVAVTTSLVLKSKAFKSGWADSDTRTDTYTLNLGTAAAPQLSPVAGTYVDSLAVTMTGPAGATVRYTTDGTEPTASSTAYTSAVTLTVTTTVKARSYHPAYTASATTTVAYTVKVGTPGFNPGAGTYAIGQVVTASGPPGATLRYTVNGTDPTATDAEFPSSGVVPVVSATLKLKAFRAGCTASDTAPASYTMTGSLTGGGIEAGEYHSLAHGASGAPWAWGYNAHGQIGDGTNTQRATPVSIATLTSITAVVAGNSHSLALKGNGTVWAFGLNGNGQLGDASTTNRWSPVQVSTASGLTSAIAVAAGGLHSLAVKSDGTVWSWGYNNKGQLGDNTTTQRTSPVQVSSLTGMTAVAAGQYHSLALKSNGTVWAFGYNVNGQLGNNSTQDSLIPVQVSSLSGVVAIAAGAHHSLALKSDGSVWAWGNNIGGQLGDNSKTQRTTPVQVWNLCT